MVLFKIAGPALPCCCTSSFIHVRLVTSPTNKGVIVLTSGFILLYELSGDDEDNLTWSLLDQKLDTDRDYNVFFPIPKNLA